MTILGCVNNASSDITQVAGITTLDKIEGSAGSRLSYSFVCVVNTESQDLILKVYNSNGGYNTGGSEMIAVKIK